MFELVHLFLEHQVRKGKLFSEEVKVRGDRRKR